MLRVKSVFRFLSVLLLLLVAPLVAAAQDDQPKSTDQAESAILQAAEEVVGEAGTEEAADPEQASPFVEAAMEPGVSLEHLEQLLVPLTAMELAGLADVWQRNLQASIEQGVTLNLSLQNASEADAEEIRSRIVEINDNRAVLQENYEAVLKAWQRKGGAEEEVLAHQNYLTALAADVVRTTDRSTMLQLAGDWLVSMDGGLGFLVQLVTILITIYAMSFVAKGLKAFTRRALDKVPDVSELLKKFILNTVYWATFAVAIVMVLAAFGVSVGPLLTVFGGLSFVLAFAMQDSLSNIASGLMIMVLKPFDLGDFVDAAGVSGEVSDLNLVSTTIRTFDNQFIIVPNSKIWNEVITNVNVAPTRRVDMVFGVGYADDTDRAKEILLELCTNHELVLVDPEPVVVVAELADSSVNINCRPWVRTDDYWTVYWGILDEAKKRFDAEGISIPFPQRDVHVYHEVAPQPIQGPREPVPELENSTAEAGAGEAQVATTPEN